jgi:hypothetical protein
MLILRKTNNAQEALKKLNERLSKALGKSKECRWTFPDGNQDTLPTWSRRVKGGYLTIGFTPAFKWYSQVNSSKLRCPILISLEKASNGISPLVEVNIPKVADRLVNGCFSLDEDRQIWLCHRGNRLTVNQKEKIPKKAIHRHFKGILVPAMDGDAGAKVIPLFALNSQGLKSGLVEFARNVEMLKAKYR